MTIRSFLLLGLCASLSLVGTTVAADPSVGIPRAGNAKFYRLHSEFLKRAGEGRVGVLFLGDSITEQWANVPSLWESAWGQYDPANFGIGGDRTEYIIWRIEEHELDNISPAAVVLLAGTNNTAENSAAEISAAMRKMVALIQEKLPDTKILLLAIFPRGPRVQGNGVVDPWELRMAKINEINADLATLDDGDRVRFLDLGPAFQNEDGTIPDRIMPDQLHLSEAGYEIWIEQMSPLLAEMVGDYEATHQGRAVNLSTRARLGADQDTVVAGLVVRGGRKDFLIRAVGPTLSNFGVTDSHPDPRMVIRDEHNEIVATNDRWDSNLSTSSSQVGAFPLNPGSNDALARVTLDPGAYTVEVTGPAGTTGNVLVECYELP
ncbi:GDSL-type esterase/lipase family protein [Synoicihabitans lomoniglobus]|uniref:GDSL-type esterase/lipase family protein n=1 Tax=Synoicihabitans lomoniglobus TaxID=2909285 RepID=A0AAF0CSH2_9BACT|nr:GDSL-type esterase/lipase family protein [Opitutaceae bacterium LMO-M01]WED67218.1 GDSL-type esterase/lipase family protein [Opitutaceae bacterium LMO-M01]